MEHQTFKKKLSVMNEITCPGCYMSAFSGKIINIQWCKKPGWNKVAYIINHGKDYSNTYNYLQGVKRTQTWVLITGLCRYLMLDLGRLNKDFCRFLYRPYIPKIQIVSFSSLLAQNKPRRPYDTQMGLNKTNRSKKAQKDTYNK